MRSFTTRPDEQWSVSDTVYQVGSSTRFFQNHNSNSDSAAVPYSSNSGATTYGATTQDAFAETRSSRSMSASNRISFTNAQTHFSSYAASYTSDQDIGTTGNNNWSSSGDESAGSTFHTGRTENDTSRATSQGTSIQSGFNSTTFYVLGGGGSTTSSGPVSVTETGPSTTIRTFSGPTTTYSTQSENLAESTITTATSNGVIGAITTTSISFETTATSQASSTWTTTNIGVSSQNSTLTTATNSVTYQNDIISTLTATTHQGTAYVFGGMLQDTVFMMRANRGWGDYNRGEILWTFSNSGFGTNSSVLGVFTDLFASTSGGTITISDYRKFATSSAEVTAVSISSSIVTHTGTAGNTYETRVSSNGSYFSTSTITTTSGTSTGTMTIANTSTNYSQSYSLGAVASTISTYTVGSTNNTSTSTIFTHTIFISGYDSSSSSWTSGTSSSTWGFATSGTSGRPVIFSSAVTTSSLCVRSTTVDSILVSSFTTTSSTSGTHTGRVTLGLVSATSSRFYSVKSTFTRVTYDADLHSTASQYVVTESETNSVYPAAGTTITRSDSFAITRFTEQRLFPNIQARPFHDNSPMANEVRHKCYALGLAGFGGSFSASSLSVFLTTTQGLAAGATFEAIHITPPSTALAVRGVSFYPIAADAKFRGLAAAQSTKLLAVPSVMTSAISIAATWTSTFGPSSAKSTSSKFATHTIGVVSSISGEFWTSEAITFNSAFRTEIEGPAAVGGFVAGDNFLGKTYQVYVQSGRATWSEFSSLQSTAASDGSSSSADGSLVFTIAASHGVVISCENVYTAVWSPSGFNSIFSSAAHQPYPSPP